MSKASSTQQVIGTDTLIETLLQDLQLKEFTLVLFFFSPITHSSAYKQAPTAEVMVPAGNGWKITQFFMQTIVPLLTFYKRNVFISNVLKNSCRKQIIVIYSLQHVIHSERNVHSAQVLYIMMWYVP